MGSPLVLIFTSCVFFLFFFYLATLQALVGTTEKFSIRGDGLVTLAGTLSVNIGGLDKFTVGNEGAVAAAGFMVTAGGLSVAVGGLTVKAGGVLVTAGGLTVQAGGLAVRFLSCIYQRFCLFSSVPYSLSYSPSFRSVTVQLFRRLPRAQRVLQYCTCSQRGRHTAPVQCYCG